MSDDIIREQIAYYRARAGEYDHWFYRVGRYDRGEAWNALWFAEAEQVRQTLYGLGRVERILEFACGTGIWTQELARIGQHVTAIDASPEVIALNRAKLGDPSNVTYQQADLFAWEPDAQYDLVAFCFWLSHVPPDRLQPFLDKVYRALRPGGHFFMVDSRREPLSSAKDTALSDEDSPLQVRRLSDGREFTVVKIYYEPDSLQATLSQVGLEAQIRTTEHFFIYGTGTRR